MAKIETIMDDLGKPLEILNIDNTVGANGVNRLDDVRIVKALFNYIPRHYKKGKISSTFNSVGAEYSWNIPSSQIPSAFDGTTWGVVEITKSFQKYANKMLSNYGYRVNVTGTIKPSKGYAVVGKNFSTIAALNIFAALGTKHYKLRYIEQIIADSRGDFNYLLEDDEDYEESGD
ncbi:MAG TPA: hypothetical protein VNB22_20835 [Pyrinomonadaceae bacterium]|nr:hypothetical protein [Pyrinomonadaceae bacterium]